MNTQYGFSTSYHRDDCRSNRNYRANRSSVRRNSMKCRAARMQRTGILAGLAVVLLVLGIILGSTFLSSSKSNAASPEPVLYKYYTSIQVQPGDTLWSIAREYAIASEISQQDYIDEIVTMNHLQSETIHTGDYLTIFYYSSEFK
ncbi:MAG: LysM peptidoglycan-binding domain-containing protein [Roseburia sp.]